MSELNQALLAAVPADGSSIGNQSLLERLRGRPTKSIFRPCAMSMAVVNDDAFDCFRVCA